MTLLRESNIIRKPPVNYVSNDAELYESSFEYTSRAPVLHRLGPVRVSSDSVVYKGMNLVGETVVNENQVPYYRFRHLVKKMLSGRPITLSRKNKYLLITDAWSAGHYHWFTEVVPKLLLIEAQAREFVLLLPDTPYVRTIGIESIKLLGVLFADVQWMEDSAFYEVPDLYYISRIAAPGQVNDSLMQEINLRLVTKELRAKRRFYVSRSDAKIRKVLNEEELEPVLTNHGYEIIRPEGRSLAQQINLFSKCDSLLGIHGAGLTNCLFMPPGGTVIELLKREPNHGYWHLASSLGHQYFYLHGTPDSELSLIGKGCNLTVSPTELDRLLSEVKDADFSS